MPKWPWIERKFNFDYPPTKFPDVLERFRGAPVRVSDLVAQTKPGGLMRRVDDGWTIQQNIGHLIRVEMLWYRRFEQFLASEPELCPADFSRDLTTDADPADVDGSAIAGEFRQVRMRTVALLTGIGEDDWARTALHPRLQVPMRLVDLLTFAAEHDDYHLARIHAIMRLL